MLCNDIFNDILKYISEWEIKKFLLINKDLNTVAKNFLDRRFNRIFGKYLKKYGKNYLDAKIDNYFEKLYNPMRDKFKKVCLKNWIFTANRFMLEFNFSVECYIVAVESAIYSNSYRLFNYLTKSKHLLEFTGCIGYCEILSIACHNKNNQIIAFINYILDNKLNKYDIICTNCHCSFDQNTIGPAKIVIFGIKKNHHLYCT